MHCSKHGVLPADWASCPYCIRERAAAGVTSVPPAPMPISDYPSAGHAGSPGDAGVTRGAGAYPRPIPADTTRGAHGYDVNAYVSKAPNKTVIIDPPPAARRRIRAWLIQKEGPRPDQVYQLNDDVTWIGREPRSDIFLDEDTVSTHHAKLYVDDDKVLRLLNVSTSNGTLVNGVRVEAPVELAENDEIKVGTVVLVLKRIDGPARVARTEPDSAAAPVAQTIPMLHTDGTP